MTYFVLDTNIVRELAHGEPQWFRTLVQLRREGHHFALHDIVAGELTAQMLDLQSRGQLGHGKGQADFQTMCDRMSAFISPDLPLWPGRKDLLPLYPHGPTAQTVVGSRYRERARAQFLAFTNILRAGRFVRTVVTIQGEQWTFGSEKTLNTAPSALQTNRDAWLAFMRRCMAMRPPKRSRHVAAIGMLAASATTQHAEWLLTLPEITDASLHAMQLELSEIPDARSRLDLAIRYFAWYQFAVIRATNHGQINPETTGRRNDAIDAELPFALFYDCIVATEDGRFLTGIDQVASAQRDRVMHIDALAGIPLILR